MRYFLCALLLCLLLPVTGRTAMPAVALTDADAQAGERRIAVPVFEDATHAASAVQAAIQFQRLQQAQALGAVPILSFADTVGQFWLGLPVANQSHEDRWRLELRTAQGFALSPIKHMQFFNDGAALKGKTVTLAGTAIANVTLPLKEAAQRYVLLDTWPGVRTPVTPMLVTQKFAANQNDQRLQQMALLWLIAGGLFGAAIVQLILTRQALQGVLALNALVIGSSAFLLQRPETIPGLLQYHPLLLPLVTAGMIGLCATALQWIAMQSTGRSALLCVLPLLANAAAVLGGALALPQLTALGIPVDHWPHLLLSGSGIVLLSASLLAGFAAPALLWLTPSWAVLAVLPWSAAAAPLLSFAAYLLMLGVAGVTSVFSHWDLRARETDALQHRLRMELKHIKDKHSQDSRTWEQKMDSQRLMLNDLKQREQQRSADLDVARREAEDANRAKSDFLAIISHEIRTPMNGILGIVQLMDQAELNEQLREYVDVVKNSGETMVTLLNDILDYSKIEKGVIDLEDIPFSLRKLAQSVIMLMSGRAKDKALDVILSIDDDVPEQLQGDPNRIRQIFLNLLGNAIKFTERGRITIAVSCDGPDRYRFDVIDSGIGIAPEAQAKLFQAYAQADASISRRYGGTGLGLNICRMLVQAMRGTIGVTSTPGQGSTFRFTLPLATPRAADAKHHAAEQMAPQHKLRVLVIDDNSLNLKVVKGLLELDGHAVTVTETAQAGLALLQEQIFDAAFVDIQMPVMDGKAFAQALRGDRVARINQLPLYALTGMVSDADKAAARAAGFDGTVVKPVTQQALRAILSSITPHDEDPETMLKDMLAKLGALAPDKRGKFMQLLTEGAQGAKDIYGVLRDEVQAGLHSDKISENEMGNTTRTESEMVQGPLDLAMLADLHKSVPKATMDELFDELVAKTSEIIATMEDASQSGDANDVTEHAHSLKGMAGNFGLRQLANAAGKIEAMGRTGEHDKLQFYVPKMRPLAEKSLQALLDWRQAQSAA